MIREQLKATQSRQKSHDDKKWRDIEFDVGDHVTSQSNCIINFMGLYACYYLNYFKCIKLWYYDIIKDIF